MVLANIQKHCGFSKKATKFRPKVAYIKYLQYICTAIKKGKVMATQRRYSVNLAPSGWAVYDNETGEKVKGFSGRGFGRIDALKYLYDLYGWNYPKGGFRS